MRSWLVDGMNVIGSRPDGWWRDRTGAMRRLVADLAGADLDGPVWVVFDGRPRDLGDPGAVHVVWAPEPGRDAADRVIAGIVEEDSRPGRWTVVTSDRALADRVRAAGAAVSAAGALRQRLDG